jgi:SAM-dependent methyltransferase
MKELLRAIGLVGLGNVVRLGRAYRLGWEEMIRGHLATTAMHALLNIGLVDEMLEKQTVDLKTFAESRNLDREQLTAVCDALTCTGLMAGKDGRYRLDSKGRLLVDVFRGWLDVSYGYAEIFQSLEPILRKQKIYGDHFYRKSDFVARGSGEMEEKLFFPLAGDIITQKGYQRVLDLGCGDGTFLRSLCRLNKDVRCFGIDLAPKAVELGNRLTREAGLEHRVSLYAGDVQDVSSMPEELKSVQAATIFFVLHEILYLGEDRLIDFLKAFRKSFPGVPLIAFEAIRPTEDQMRRRPGVAIYYFLYHSLSHQKPVSREEWRRLFKAAGWSSIEERHLWYARTSIFTLS